MMTEIDKNIELDLISYLSEDTIFLNEGKPDKIDDHLGDGSITKRAGNAFNKAKATGQNGLNKIKALIDKSKKMSDEDIINNSPNLANSLIKDAVVAGGGSIVGGPVVGALSLIVAKTITAKNMHKKRANLYRTLKADLELINVKLKDMENISDPSKEQLEKKYALKKLQIATKTNMDKLAAQLKKDGWS
jgi:hypothetical protein